VREEILWEILVAALGDPGHAWTMRLRWATPADLEILVEVQREGAVQALGHIFPQATYPFPRDEVLARWAEEIADPAINVYVIETDAGNIGGFAASRGNELLHFGTAVQTWGSGLAVEAHNEILQRLAAAGVVRCWLRVFQDNHRAIRFYEKLGWRATAKLTRSAFAPHPVLVEYERDL
jgi:RimJ/RimL family protein N-acetyltransferase